MLSTGKPKRKPKGPGKRDRHVLVISIIFAVAIMMGGAYAQGAFATGSFVKERSSLELPDPGSGETEFSYGGVVWIILKDNRQGPVAGSGEAGDGAILIVTRDIYNEGNSLHWAGGHKNGKYYHQKNTFVFYEESHGMLKHAMDEWYRRFVTGDLKALACFPVLGYEADAPPPDWNAMWDEERGISLPGEPAGRKTAGVVFPLSISEVNRYIYDGENIESRIAADSGGTARAWWLRSPGVSSGGPVADVRRNGNINSNGATSDARGFRPAMWIDTAP